MEVDEYDYCYCKYKFPCVFKWVAKSRTRQGRYYVLCLNPEGCNQKSLFSIYIDINNKTVEWVKRKIRFKKESIIKWKRRAKLHGLF